MAIVSILYHTKSNEMLQDIFCVLPTNSNIFADDLDDIIKNPIYSNCY